MKNDTFPASRSACNIDARGRAVRLVMGVIVTLAGVAMVAFWLMKGSMSPQWWWLIGLLLAGGGFMIYEGWAGWCALRAMGVRTKW